MLKEIRDLHELTKIGEVLEDAGGPVPITFTHVFHKEYPRLPKVALPEIQEEESELETLLGLRESTRNFSDLPLKLEHIAKALRSCRVVDRRRHPERRTYPSGGARFPVEIYLVAFNVEGLEEGAYHYNIMQGNLEQLWKKGLKSRRRELISPYLENPAATVIFTSVIARSEVKYGHKAFQFSFIEAGHMGQNMQLACAESGIGCCSVSGFVNNSISEILDLTDDEIPIYTISMGWKRR